MYQRPVRELNMHSAALNPAALERALVLSGMTWGMPMAQFCGMQLQDLLNPTILITEVKDDKIVFKPQPTALFCMGLPVEIDKELPQGTVQLKYQGAVIFEIQMCAIPYGFPVDFETSGK